MPVIKRYPNRKLYDTEAKKYVTLEGIAELIRKRQDVQVVDNATGEDLTALTLSLIIFEQQKRHSAFIPHSVLAGLIRAGGDTLNTLRQNLVAALGLSRLVDEEIERRIKRLVGIGELSQEDGRCWQEKLVSHIQPGHSDLAPDEQVLERLLIEQGIPTRDDYQRIVDQLNVLAAKLEELENNAETL
jgi:polyhydroxyalkanoate synthesis repressor PhaR